MDESKGKIDPNKIFVISFSDRVGASGARPSGIGRDPVTLDLKIMGLSSGDDKKLTLDHTDLNRAVAVTKAKSGVM